MKIGVLALQGAVAEHVKALSRLGVETIEVKLPHDLENLDALIMPGGESTTISKLLSLYELTNPLKERIKGGFPVFGTCAGMILLAKEIVDSKIEPIGGMDISVRRNAYGRQIDSFEQELEIPELGKDCFPGVFIRAPIVESINNGVEVLCKINGNPVAVRQGKLLACTFHPELTEDIRLHRYFIGMV